MEQSNSNFGNSNFLDENSESGAILYSWLKRSGVERSVILEEITTSNQYIGEIGLKSFKQWTSEGETARRVSGLTPEIRGERIVAIVQWFIREHIHRVNPVLTTSEVRRLIALYQDIPVKNRLQLKRLLHDLEIETGERQPDFSFATDWKNHLASWPAFCFVIDEYWCVRASTSYEMALAGYTEEDMKHWSWWHRLTASKSGKPKFSPNSLRYSLRGPYNLTYYCNQLNQFYHETKELCENQDPRYQALMELLKTTSLFEEMWNCSLEKLNQYQQPFSLPVPFFRPDGTLLWMLELSTVISNTNNYRLISWMPLNEDSAEYQGEIKRWADKSGKFNQRAYFIEDFAQYFTRKEKFALGLE